MTTPKDRIIAAILEIRDDNDLPLQSAINQLDYIIAYAIETQHQLEKRLTIELRGAYSRKN